MFLAPGINFIWCFAIVVSFIHSSFYQICVDYNYVVKFQWLVTQVKPVMKLQTSLLLSSFHLSLSRLYSKMRAICKNYRMWVSYFGECRIGKSMFLALDPIIFLLLPLLKIANSILKFNTQIQYLEVGLGKPDTYL